MGCGGTKGVYDAHYLLGRQKASALCELACWHCPHRPHRRNRLLAHFTAPPPRRSVVLPPRRLPPFRIPSAACRSPDCLCAMRYTSQLPRQTMGRHNDLPTCAQSRTSQQTFTRRSTPGCTLVLAPCHTQITARHRLTVLSSHFPHPTRSFNSRYSISAPPRAGPPPTRRPVSPKADQAPAAAGYAPRCGSHALSPHTRAGYRPLRRASRHGQQQPWRPRPQSPPPPTYRGSPPRAPPPSGRLWPTPTAWQQSQTRRQLPQPSTPRHERGYG